MWQPILKPLDRLIDGITMYRLLLYYLTLLVLGAIGLSAAGVLHYKAQDIAISAATLVLACWLFNKALARYFNAPVNPESSLLTGLILALIIPPTPNGKGFGFMLAAAGLAMASKYLLTYRQKLIFNPAAVAVVITGLAANQNANWWVGTKYLLPLVIVGGLLIMRKLRRELMIISFLVVTTITTATLAAIAKTAVSLSLKNMVLSSAVFFLAFVMLTEPKSSPTTRGRQLLYAAIVGFIMAPQVHLGHQYSSPEIALAIGNIFAFIVSPKIRESVRLIKKVRIADKCGDFIFEAERPFKYQPGQYMEWTLPHDKPDDRGSRRYFTLASSPTEPNLMIGVKFYAESSSFKAALLEADQTTPIVVAQLSGDFVLPKDPAQKLTFIAGGIGITPFRSMIKYLLDSNQTRDIRLLYSAGRQVDLAYLPLFEEARQKIGLAPVYTLTDEEPGQNKSNTRHGPINADLIAKEVPDFLERHFYISGSHSMVTTMQANLHNLGVKKHQIKTDFFPGYA